MAGGLGFLQHTASSEKPVLAALPAATATPAQEDDSVEEEAVESLDLHALFSQLLGHRANKAFSQALLATLTSIRESYTKKMAHRWNRRASPKPASLQG